MHLLKYLAVSLVAVSASASTLGTRTFAQLYSALKAVDNATNQVTSALTSWNGTPAGAAVIAQKEQDLEYALDNAIAVANNEPPESAAECKQLQAYITDVLSPDVCKLLNAYESRRKELTAAGYGQFVTDAKARIRARIAKLYDALRRVCPSAAAALESSQSNLTNKCG